MLNTTPITGDIKSMIQKKKRIIISRDIIFDESKVEYPHHEDKTYNINLEDVFSTLLGAIEENIISL